MKIYPSRQLLLFTIAIHAVYFIGALFFKGIYLVDSYGYMMQADNIRNLGTWYAEDWNAPLLVDYFSIRPPLYAWLLMGLGTVWGNIYFVLLLQNVLSILNVWMLYRFVKKHFGESARMQLFFVLGLLFYPAQMMHANFVMTEIVFQTILVWLFMFLYAFVEKPDWSRSFGIAMMLSIGLLTKPISGFLLFVVLLVSILTMQWNRRNIKYILPFGIVIFVLHIICLQNEHATGSYHFTSIKTINQLKYNARYTLIDARGEVYADSVIAGCMKDADAAENYGERLNRMDAGAMRIIQEYPYSFLKVYAKGVVAFFLDPGRFDVYHYFAIEEKNTPGLLYEIQTKGWGAIGAYLKQAPVFAIVLLALNLCWNLMVVCSFVCFLFSKKAHVKFRLTIFLIVFYIAAATGPVGVSRYRVPIYPFLLISVLVLGAHKRNPDSDTETA